ncbi:MAG: phosphonate ABC transporter, permease protein PhnE [Acetobacteraceae bacterium]|nr:phosphonate ABC transporter, permease protein PhnE [Acetobacteraceae bacterium]
MGDSVSWSPPPLIRNPWLRYGLYIGAAIYLSLALGTLHLNWARLAQGLDRGWAFISAFAHPDIAKHGREIFEGFVESLTMTAVATAAGVAISLPVGLGAARNLVPMPVYLLCRGIIAVSRTFPEIIVAILFVKMFGFGPLAGVATLAFATIGFMSKLLAEDIEDIDASQVEAIRATGAGPFQVLNYAVQPQVMARFIGLSVYRLDINFRESAVIGIVGAGGIGATLNTSFERYEFDTAASILLMIIGIVMVTEYASSLVRGRLR